MSIVRAATDLCAATVGRDWQPEAVKRAKSALAGDAPLSSITDALAICVEHLKKVRIEDADGAAHVAIAAGALVERGGAPGPLADVLIGAMPRVLAAAHRFARVCVDSMPPLSDDGDDEGSAIAYFENRHIPRAAFDAAAKDDIVGAAAFARLELWTLPIVAALTRSKNHLIKAQADDALVAAAHGMDGSNAHWLSVLLDAELDQTWYVVDSRCNRGFMVIMDGVVSNFDIHSLLAAALVPLGIEGEAPSPEVIAFLEGRAPAPADDSAHGTWNLYDIRAINADLTKPRNVPMDHWVWGEGRPKDIVRGSKQRFLVIGAAPYERNWSLGRTFSALPQSIAVKRELTPTEIGDLIGAP
jgi:hypothetical protein